MRSTLFGMLILLAGVSSARAGEEWIEYPPFGQVAVYRPSGRAARVAIVLSDDAGWPGSMADVGAVLTDAGALVVGVDAPAYVKALDATPGDEVYPSADLELLGQFVQRALGVPAYVQPVLVGYGSGGALAYAVLAQGNPNTFQGAISLDFCPELRLPKPPGEGRGLEWRREANGDAYTLEPAAGSDLRWVAIQDRRDDTCAASSVGAFVAQTPHAKLITAGDGWRGALRTAFLGLAGLDAVEDQGVEAADVGGLPLVEVAASGPPSDVLAVMVSGDGGWASIDRDIGKVLADRGVPVVGLDALRYFWRRRTPAGAADDVARVADHYLAAWGKRRLLLLGYSRGADVLPFVVNRLPPALQRRVALVVLMGPETRVDFEFHLADWIGNPSAASELPVLPEAERLRRWKVLCVYGTHESDSLCPRLDATGAERWVLPGGHHFGGDYDAIAARILREARV